MCKAIALLGLMSLFACQQTNSLTGTYSGLLPCASCPGIAYQLTLYPDMSYKEEVEYQEKGGEIILTNGKYALKNDTVLWLQDKPSTEGMHYFSIQENTLTMLDRSGKPMSGKLASHYVLAKSN